ncbi:thymidylate kinase [Candidatus Nomurabacteria bacterium]|nr:thymidylate kinase [Candidatus Kaiserbacteria bacterium]MCB9815192.1 thymidylate kinase [Candidatus Nomurabacteria bacterium]
MLFVIDGSDGSGKATQVALLGERLGAEGHQVKTIDFPRYTDNKFGKLLRECLDGKRGDFMKMDPRIASTLYAADRFESSGLIREWLDSGNIVVADRYVSANMLHQGTKVQDEVKLKDFLTWLDEVEHGVFNLPRPDLIIYLEVPYSVRGLLLKNDKSRKSLDSSELDEEHQIATEKAAQTLVSSLNNWQPVNCVKDGQLRSREDIHEEIYQLVCSKLK